VGYWLRMSAEISDWLAELCSSEPAAGAEVGAALVSAMAAADIADLPLAGQLPVPDPRAIADSSFQRLAGALQQVRRSVAEAVTNTGRLQKTISQREREPETDASALAELRRQLDEASQREHDLMARSQRLQGEVDAFRTAKETAKAMYTAAEARLRVEAAVKAASAQVESPGAALAEAESAAEDDSAGDNDRTPPGGDDLSQALAAAAVTLRAATARAGRTLREMHGQPGQAGGEAFETEAEPAAGLLGLRCDPLGSDIRILFAVEPADALSLLAVLAGEDAVVAHLTLAIRLAGELLADIRAGAWPPDHATSPAEVEVTFGDTATFLEKFFPDSGGAVAERAGVLGAARSLRALRESRGLTRASLARQADMDEERLRLLEDEGLRLAEVHEATALVRALGGSLELTAQAGENPVELF